MDGMKRRRVYFDYAATTPLDPRVFEAMEPFFGHTTSREKIVWGNPGSIHGAGVFAKNAVLRARSNAAKTLNAHPDEIIFTSGGTESNNLALLGIVKKAIKERKNKKDVHIIVSEIEHASILDVSRALEKDGVSVSLLRVDKNGFVDFSLLKKLLRNETVLVSVMYANNEIGTIEPIRKIAEILKNFRARKKGISVSLYPLFHSDASQAPLYLNVSPEYLGVDALTIDGQKIYGPKGIGVLYKRRGVPLEPVFYGGGQEFRLRPGTENVPGIVGFAKALSIAVSERERETKRLLKLRDYFIGEVLKTFPQVRLNGDARVRVANNANFSFLGINSTRLVLELDARGIAVSSKSACLNEEEGSYVISALRKGREYGKSSVRFTFGRKTDKKDLEYAVKILREILNNATMLQG